MKPQSEIGGLFLSLLLIAGSGGLTTGAIANATPQTASPIDTTPVPSAKLPPRDWHPEIIVRVHNYARIDNGLLLSAEAVATSILREAKVEARWVYCPLSQEDDERYPQCPADWGTNAFVLNILTPEMVRRIQTRVENLGSAPAPCNEDATSCPINVFYFRLVERAEQFGIQPERLLGHVLAHEVGHLLGENHSPKGIMRGAWGRDDLKLMDFSILEFSTDQAKQLRDTLSRRAARQEASQNVRFRPWNVSSEQDYIYEHPNSILPVGTSPATSFASGVDSSPTIRVRVNNYTQASPAILAGAEREAGRILDRAGLRTVWLDCPAGHSTADPQDPCGEPLEATDIVLRVLFESSQNKFQDTAFGFAVVPVLASVYYDYVAHLARSDNAEFEIPIILGCVIAHEIGHLLLGSNSHADTGVMQGHWGRGQIRRAMTGTLLFTQEQARLIRAETQKRMRLQTSA